MDKSQQILKVTRDRLGNQPTYNPVEFLEMCAAVRDELEVAEQRLQADMACVCPLDEFGMYQMPALSDGTCPTCRKPYR